MIAIGELHRVVLDGERAQLVELTRDLGHEPRDPRRQQRIIVELIAEARWLLEERHAEGYRGMVAA